MRFALPILTALLLTFPGERQPTPTGDVWVEMVPAGTGGPKQGVGRGLVEEPPDRVFRALTDYAHWHEFMPFLLSSEAGAPRPDGSVVSTHHLELPAPLGERRYQVRFVQKVEAGPAGKVWRIDWSYVAGSGNVRAHQGSWTLTAFGDGYTFATCRIQTDPGGLNPGWAVDRGTAKMLPWIFHGLRQHVRRSRYDVRPMG